MNTKEILKEKLINFSVPKGFKSFKEEDWKLFEESGALEIILSVIEERSKQKSSDIQLININEAYYRCRQELEEAKRLNSEFFNVLKIYEGEDVGSEQVKSMVSKVLQNYK